MLTIVCGEPGVGKSTAAHAIPGMTIRTDVVRKSLVDEPEYTSEETLRTYNEVFDQARDALAGESGVGDVVLDGTFRRRAFRLYAGVIAMEMGHALRIIRVYAPRSAVVERLKRREGGASDAGIEAFEQVRDEFEPVEREEGTSVHLINNNGTVDELVAALRSEGFYK